VAGDSLGPKVGDLLISKYSVDAYVYGKTSSPVTGLNCLRYFEHVRVHHGDSLVIAVDACLGNKNDVGKIKYSLDGLRAGSALDKKLGRIGDIGFLGVVAPKSANNMASLVSAQTESVDGLAEKIAEKIYNLTLNLRLTYIF
jgi:putative sporulation protein YyaC